MSEPTPRLPAERYVGREISSGTMRARDLVPKFVTTLSEVWPTHELCERYHLLGVSLDLVGQFTGDPAEDVADLLGIWECESMGHLLEGLFDALNEVAPAGTTFGASEGDGASYGFWTYVDPFHPARDECLEPECVDCAVRDCPYGEPLHYHHDGCPACDGPAKG
jgi:hypothetical protein